MTKQVGAARRSTRLAVPRNARNTMGGVGLLRSLRDGEAQAAFFDPQYRGLLDKMGYGNEGLGREKKRAALAQMTDDDITVFVEEIARVLAPSRYLFLWVDKFTFASGHHLRYWARADGDLQLVDAIAWNKLRPGMGRRARCWTEFVVVLQKEPTRAKGTWSDHAIEDCWGEASDRSAHPHAKPRRLIERLIRSTTKRGDLVVDPAAGSYVVLDACAASGREFVGCDLNP